MARKPRKRRAAKLKRTPARKRRDLRREEFDRLVEIVNQHGELINDARRDLDIQFKRTAQIQSELDETQRSLQRLAGQLKD
jgi:ribosome-binding protein aMBF1 (putative translation factor)